MTGSSIAGSIAWTIALGWFVHIPFGIIIGALGQRLSYKNYLTFIGVPNPIWNASVKLIISFSVVNVIYSQSCDVAKDDGRIVLWILTYVFGTFAVTSGALVGSSFQPVAITGGIACGKSTVGTYLEKRNFLIIDLDSIAHDVLDPYKMGCDSAYPYLVEEFGNGILNHPANTKTPHPPIDRQKLADIVFSDPAKRKKLNGVTHPLIFKTMMKLILTYTIRHPTMVVAVDIPLLYETGGFMTMLFALVVVVATTPSIQMARLKRRNPSFTEEHCRERIDSQMSMDKKVRKADLVVWNNEGLGKLEGRVDVVAREVMGRVVGFGVRFLSLIPVVAFGVLLLEGAVFRRCVG